MDNDLPTVTMCCKTSCMECDGEGYYEYINNYGSSSYYTRSNGDPWGPEYVTKNCTKCEGSGKEKCAGCGYDLEDQAYDVEGDLWCSLSCYNNPKFKHQVKLTQENITR